MADLHVFTDDEADWFVAATAEEAAAQQREMTGITVEDQADWTFRQLPDDEPLTIRGEEGDPDENGVTKTCGEWAVERGRCLLCSTEY